MFEIKKYNSDKDNIILPPITKSQTLATPLCSHVFIGRSGSGKTNLLLNILKDTRFYKASLTTWC